MFRAGFRAAKSTNGLTFGAVVARLDPRYDAAGMMSKKSSLIAGLVAVVIGAAGTARAETETGVIVYSRDGALWRQAPRPDAVPERIASLPEGVSVKALAASRDGRLLTLAWEGHGGWIVEGELRTGPCTGLPVPSPAGTCFACPTADGHVLHSSTRDVAKRLPEDIQEPTFLGPRARQMAGVEEGGVVAFLPMKPDKRRVLARPGAISRFLASPDGTRGVAIVGTGVDSRIVSFLLDGEGVPRRLGGPGVPVTWSPDSQWVLLHEGEIPEPKDGDHDDAEGEEAASPPAVDPFLVAAPRGRKHRTRTRKNAKEAEVDPSTPLTRACAVRAVGGEVKCWDRYDGLSFSPDSTQVLLARDGAVYVAELAGVRARPPRKLLDRVDGPALWLPTFAVPPVPAAPAPPRAPGATSHPPRLPP